MKEGILEKGEFSSNKNEFLYEAPFSVMQPEIEKPGKGIIRRFVS